MIVEKNYKGGYERLQIVVTEEGKSGEKHVYKGHSA